MTLAHDPWDEPACLAHVPTVVELAERGLARGVEFTKAGVPTHYVISRQGQRLMADAMAHNAKILLTNPELEKRARAAAMRRKWDE